MRRPADLQSSDSRELDFRSGRDCVTALGKSAVPLSPSSIIWYRPNGGVALWLGGTDGLAWRKVMTVYTFGHLRADCLAERGSPTLVSDMGQSCQIGLTQENNIGQLVWGLTSPASNDSVLQRNTPEAATQLRSGLEMGMQPNPNRTNRTTHI